MKHLNFALERGDFVTLIGATGSGKSTFLKQFLPRLATGKVISGEIETELSQNTTNFAYVSQFVDNQIIMETPRDELKFVLDNQGCGENELQLRISEIASFLNIVDFLDVKVNNLSGGQKQLINLASALVLKPQVLLLDEPTAQLDPIASEKLLQVVHKVNEEFSLTIVLVEHELEQVVKFSNRLVVMEHGRIILDRPIDAGLREIFQMSSYQNYLTQVDRLALELKLAEHEALPLSNKTLNQFVRPVSNKLQIRKSIKEASNKTVVFQADKVNFRFDFNGDKILNNISLKLQAGQSYCVVGPNGTGKTTLLKVLTQQLSAQSGKLLFEGKKLKTEFYQRVFVLPQNPATLFVKDTVREELNYQLDIYQSQTQLTDILEEFSLSGLEETNPYDLSGGQQEFLALALGFIKQPKLLFLDEPTKGLDPNKRIELGQKLQAFQENGGTIFANSHDLLFAVNYFDQVAMMFSGKLSEFADPREFFSNKFFYTTEINKALRDIFPTALTWKDIQRNES